MIDHLKLIVHSFIPSSFILQALLMSCRICTKSYGYKNFVDECSQCQPLLDTQQDPVLGQINPDPLMAEEEACSGSSGTMEVEDPLEDVELEELDLRPLEDIVRDKADHEWRI